VPQIGGQKGQQLQQFCAVPAWLARYAVCCPDRREYQAPRSFPQTAADARMVLESATNVELPPALIPAFVTFSQFRVSRSKPGKIGLRPDLPLE
jgi:hypothetical protein